MADMEKDGTLASLFQESVTPAIFDAEVNPAPAGARLLALSSGSVDVVFWARNHAEHDTLVNTGAWKALLRDHPDLENSLTEEEEARIRSARDAIFAIRAVENEQPEGTILSRPFYSDWYAYLIRRE